MRFVSTFLDNADHARISILAPALRPMLNARILYYLRIFFISTLMIWTPLCLFFGAVHERSNHVYRLHLDLVDLDNGPVGRNLTQHILESGRSSAQTAPRWRVRTDLHTLEETRAWIRLNGWGAVVINSGASQRLLETSDAYDPRSAVTVVANTGRNPITGLTYTQPALSAAARSATLAFNAAVVKQQQMESGIPDGPVAVYFRTIDAAPMAFNIAPIQPLFAFLVSTLCTVGALISWKMTTFGFFLRVRHRHVWAGLLALVMFWTLLISMHCALAVSFFRGPHYNHNALPYTVGRFFSIWATTWAVLLAVGLWLLSWYLMITPEFLGLLSLITVLSNVVSTLVPVQMTSRYYRWFYALPFYNGAMLYRFILSGCYPRLGLNIGVLLGEITTMAMVLGLSAWARQACVRRGLSDVPGWYRGNMFFHSPVPLQQDTDEDEQHHWCLFRMCHRSGSRRRQNDAASTLSIADSINDSTSLKEGNLGV
ncbi:hypothetical protein FB645_004317 [Coemansia sp. IMI 203386]|nr:hypothetical protein FB645_004317 [Coemansia sp. IMI 203386]